jgi:putative hydrolase of the HAD superfamily
MLDMDGTLLDLGFDNWMWTQFIPLLYARLHGMEEEAARTMLFAKFRSLEGRLDWYCLDHWSEFLGLDVAALHREMNDRIGYLPGARAFLETVAGHDLRLVMVTNSHRETLAIKTEVTGVAEFFDEIYTSHDIGHPKEDQPFWAALQEAEGFDSRRTLFIDDNLAVLRSARTFGIGMLLQILCPERDGPAREAEGFAAIDGVASLLQC